MADPTKITLGELPGYLATQGASFVEGADYNPYMAKRGYQLVGSGPDAYWQLTGTPGVTATPVTPLQKYQNIAMTGQLPEDVVQAIQQRAAEFGVATGMPGSELAGYGGLRQLGLTSLDVLGNAAKYDITPYQQSVLQQQNLTESQRQQMALEEASNQRNAQLADLWRQTTGTTPGYTMAGGTSVGSPLSKTSAVPSATAGGYGGYGGYGTSPYGTSSSPLSFYAPQSNLDVLLSAINQGTTGQANIQTGYGNYGEVNPDESQNLDWVNSPFGGYKPVWTEEQDYWTI